MELLFSQLGSRQKSQYQNDTVVDTTKGGYYDGYKLKLTYVQVPLLVHFTDKKIIAGGIGFLYGQLVGAQEWEDYNDGRGYVKTETNLQRALFNGRSPGHCGYPSSFIPAVMVQLPVFLFRFSNKNTRNS